MLGALPHQVGGQNSVSLTNCSQSEALLIRCGNMKLQYGREKSKEATAEWDCMVVMGTEHGRGYGAPAGSRDRDASRSMRQRQWNQACDQTSRDLCIVQGRRASRPPHTLTLPDIQ